MSPRFCSVCVALMLSACGKYELAATWNEIRGDAYELDAISRDLAADQPGTCPDLPTVIYRGEAVPYARPVQVAPAFAERLRAFERVVVDVSTAHYGRPPDRLLHFGARVCRSVRGNATRLSEHALGNALDLAGFEWKRDKHATRFAQRFSVSVLRHWSPADDRDQAALHRDFLRALVARVDDEDVFRGIVGPGREGHANHLHFDHAPWSYTLF